MELLRPDPSIAPYGLRAVTMVARAATGGLVDTHRVLLETIQGMLLGTELDIDTLPDVDPDTLADRFHEPALRRQLIRGMVLVSLAVGPTSPAQAELIGRFASALDVREPAVQVVEHLANKEMVRFALDFYRRSNLRDYLNNQYRTQGGILAVAKAVLGLRGLVRDRELAARFRALGDLPADTLGHGFFHYYSENSFAFPGEPGGFPVGAVFHDFGHVLAGYDSSPEGELQIASFQAGYRRNEDSFFTILFAVLIHTAGVNVAPIPMPTRLGRVGEGTLMVQMLHALERGSRMTVDLGVDWDFWPLVTLPLEQVRARLGVPPLDPAFAGKPGTAITSAQRVS